MEIETIELTPAPGERVLLACFAHPDDESFGPGGTLARYAREGVAVHLICATKGEVGAADPEHLAGHDSPGAMRSAELQCAARHLGLTAIHFLGYRDSGMPGSPDNEHPQALAAAPVEEVAAKIAHLIRWIRPQVVVTFDPIGGYYHPDHIAIHKATVAAFPAAGDPHQFPDPLPPHKSQKLYYSTFSRRQIRWMVRIMALLGQKPRQFGRNKDIDLVKLTEVDFPLHARIDIRDVVDVKRQAAACHKSQQSFSRNWFVRLFFRRNLRREMFMRAHPAAANRLRESDLFEGI